MNLKTPTISDIKNKTVLVRVDYNVPLKKVNGKNAVVADDRIVASLETIQFLLEHQAKVVLISHLGRPDAKNRDELSLNPIAQYMQDQLKLPITFVPHTIGTEVQKTLASTPFGSIVMLENLRFDSREEENDLSFARELSTGCDVFVNEAFSASHRAHASVVGITKYLPAFAGFALAHEVETFTKILKDPKRPVVIILGGAKISDKVGAIEYLADVADIVLVGGAVANNFLKAEGLETYKSYIEEASSDLKKKNINYTDVAEALIEEHKTEKMLMDGYIPLSKILYPIDVIAAKSLDESNEDQTKIIDLTIDIDEQKQEKDTHKDLLYLDIGPKTCRLYQQIIASAKTIFWNGPMGVWENELFESGSKKIARSVADSRAFSIIGGGDTIACVNHFNLDTDYDYVSAAGGAALDYLSGKELPGLKPLYSGEN